MADRVEEIERGTGQEGVERGTSLRVADRVGGGQARHRTGTYHLKVSLGLRVTIRCQGVLGLLRFSIERLY